MLEVSLLQDSVVESAVCCKCNMPQFRLEQFASYAHKKAFAQH